MGGVHGVRISLKELDIPAIFSWLVIQERFGATFSPAGQEQPSLVADWLDSDWREERTKAGRHAVSAVSNDGRKGRLGERQLGYKRGT